MEGLIERLPGCKTATHRAIRWCPCGAECKADGVLEIHATGKAVRRYLLAELFTGTDFDGRGFELLKNDGERYHAFIGRDGRTTCDCKAGTYGRVAKCVHLEAVLALLENNWLPDPRNDPRPSVWPHPEQVA